VTRFAPSWTEAHRALALRARREGYGATAISKAIGRSRSAVIAELWRMGEPGFLKGGAEQHGRVFRPGVAAPSPPRSWSWEASNG